MSQPTESKATKKLLCGSWAMVKIKCDDSSENIIEPTNQGTLTFYDDHTYVQKQPYSDTTVGKWRVNQDGTSISRLPVKGSTSVLKKSPIEDTSFVYSEKIYNLSDSTLTILIVNRDFSCSFYYKKIKRNN